MATATATATAAPEEEWTEKYRPTSLAQMALTPVLRDVLGEAAESGQVPHLLLYGPAGTGKTTAAQVLIRQYYVRALGGDAAAVAAALQLDVLTLNASDDRSLDMVRNQLQQFMCMAPAARRGLRFVFLDEFDAMTKPAQLALKTLIRDSADGTTEAGERVGVRFVLICNYLSRVDPRLCEELVCLRFNALPAAAVAAFLQSVARAEGRAPLGAALLARMRERHGSDMRSMLHCLQHASGDGGGEEDGGEDDGGDGAEGTARRVLAHMRSGAADAWTARERRAAVLLMQATDHPERAISPRVRQRVSALLFRDEGK